MENAPNNTNHNTAYAQQWELRSPDYFHPDIKRLVSLHVSVDALRRFILSCQRDHVELGDGSDFQLWHQVGEAYEVIMSESDKAELDKSLLPGTTIRTIED